MDNITALFCKVCLGREDDSRMKLLDLTGEQQELITRVKSGRNVLVDACIGSGKTTAIQVLCDEFSDRKILYLTYNKLLKADAQAKILNQNANVTNYHGYVYGVLIRNGITVGVSDLLQTFNKTKPDLPSNFDLLVIDEYQDIEQESADMLEYIRSQNPGVQIVAVGDMEQKIYDKTTLDVPVFIDAFLGDHDLLHFTKCFRLNAEHAAMLGRIWGKTIVGVNDECNVREMTRDEVILYLAKQKASDVLCLGSRTGDLSVVLNELEDIAPTVYNKHTTYASIRDGDEGIRPGANNAIFTTYDGCKGLERPICVVFDFTEDYWNVRANMPGTKYEILRNIFCVAASRGKKEIIFVRSEKGEFLTEAILSQKTRTETNFAKPFPISDMFSFKYKEDVEACYRHLTIQPVKRNHRRICVEGKDALIDLSPCIGIYQEASYFRMYDIDMQIEFEESLHADRRFKCPDEDASIEDKILYLTTLTTTQARYIEQVQSPFITSSQKKAIHKRLSSVFDGYESVQQQCSIRFLDNKDAVCAARGMIDVIKNDVIYELKFVTDLTHEHFLQLACYLIAMDKKIGVLWNVKNNEMFTVAVLPENKQAFLDSVVNTITKGVVKKYRPAF